MAELPRAMAGILQYGDLLDHGVMLEYQLPLTSRRLDFMVTGKGQSNADNAVIVELKQWDKCGTADGENEVVTFVGEEIGRSCIRRPGVGRYRMYLSDTHTAFHEGDNPVSLGLREPPDLTLMIRETFCMIGSSTAS